MKYKHIYRVQKGQNYSLFTKNGLKHNLSGPALVIGDDKYYYVHGESYTYSQWIDFIKCYRAYERIGSIEDEMSFFDEAANSPDGIYIHSLERNSDIIKTTTE